jgi:hypothetical protein
VIPHVDSSNCKTKEGRAEPQGTFNWYFFSYI